MSPDDRNHSGYYARDKKHIRYMTLLLKSRGWHQVVDADQFTKPFSKQILSFQLREGMDDDGLVGEETFRKLHTARL
jgi:murein L,D-transpeptidase YcbB/YkuD